VSVNLLELRQEMKLLDDITPQNSKNSSL